MYYEASDYTILYLDLPEVEVGNSTIHPIYLSDFPDTIEGSGSVEITVSTQRIYSGVFYAYVKAEIDGEMSVVATLRVDLTVEPSALITGIDLDTIRESKWFKYPYQSSTGYYVLLERKNVTIHIANLNPGALDAVLKVTGNNTPFIIPSEKLEFDEDRDAINITLPVIYWDYVEPGTYELNFAIQKKIFKCTYNDATGVWEVYEETLYNLTNVTHIVTVEEVDPPPFVWDLDTYIEDLDFQWTTDDNLYLDIDVNAKIYADIRESCLNCYDPANFPYQAIYSIFDFMAQLCYNDGGLYGIGGMTSTRLTPNQGGDAYWESVQQTVTKQDDFPYMYIKRTHGTIRVNRYEHLPLSIYDIMRLARTSGARVTLRVLNWHPGQNDYDEIYDYVEVYPYVFEPPFYAILSSDVDLSEPEYNVSIWHSLETGYVLSVPLHFKAHIDVDRIMGDEEFQHSFELMHLPDTSNDTAVLIVTVKVSSDTAEYELGQKVYPLYMLEENPYGFEANITGMDTGTIEFTMRYNDETGEYEPYEGLRHRTIGDILFNIGDLNGRFDPWVLRTIKWLDINISLYDKVFNRIIATIGGRYNISEAIRKALGESTGNSPPYAGLEYSPRIISVGDEVVFNSTSMDSDGRIVEARWQIIDENGTVVYEATETIFTYSFSKPGTYIIVLIVKDNEGATSNTSAVIHVLGNLVIAEEVGVDLGSIPGAMIINPGKTSIVIEVKHVATGLTKTIIGKNPISISDIIYMQPNTPYQGLFELTIKIGSNKYPEVHVWLDILILDTGEVYVNVVETWNTWLQDSNGVWRPVKKNGDPINVNRGGVLRVRSYEIWEKIYLGFLGKFLEEAGFPQNKINWLLSNIKIRYEKGAHPHYEYWTNTLVLPAKEEIYCLSYIKTPRISGWYNLVLNTWVRCDESLEDFYHEFGHAIKYNFYSQQDIMRKILDSLGTGGQHQVDEPFPAYFNIKYLSSIGAYDEGHSEFFATLVVEYIRGTIYYNTTLPLYDRARFYDEYDAQHVFQRAGGTSFYGTKYDGYTVEGRVAGALLAVLYGSPDPSLGPNYKSRPADAVRAYRYFLDGIGFCEKYLGRVPLNIREAFYGIMAAHPELIDKIMDYASPQKYNLMLILNNYSGPTGSVWGRLVIVTPRRLSSIEASYQNLGSIVTISVNDIVLFYATPFARIYTRSLVPIPCDYRFVLIDPMNAKVVLIADVSGSFGSYIQFHRSGLRLVGEMKIYIYFMNGSTVTVYGNNFVIVPHSAILIEQDNDSTSITVLEGEIELETSNGDKYTIDSGKKASLDPIGNLITISNVDISSIDDWWNKPITVDMNETMPSEIIGEEPIKNIYRMLLSRIVYDPSTGLMGGNTLKIIVYLNETLVQNTGYEGIITIIIRDKYGKILLNKTQETNGLSTITSSLNIPILYSGPLNIEVYIDNMKMREDTINVGFNYLLVIIPVIIIALIAIIIAIRRRH